MSNLIINFWARFKREVLLVAYQHRGLVFNHYYVFYLCYDVDEWKNK